jgi:hypothetical protein
MPDGHTQVANNIAGASMVSGLEAKLRQLFAEQARLRALLEETRSSLDQVNCEVLQLQQEYCTSPDREQEYRHCLTHVLGFDPHLDFAEITASSGETQDMAELLEELERQGRSASSPEVP